MSNGNTPAALWGKVDEVLIKDIPPRIMPLRTSKWLPLAEDILLRLEETKSPFALRVPMADVETADRCRAGIGKLFTRLKGEQAVKIEQRANVLYFYRDTNWS